MRSLVVAIAALAVCARAQIPNLGFCPEYLPMTGFDMERFSGIWYEAERYVQFSDLTSRCLKANYTKGADGKYHVLNEYTNRITGVKRILEGEIRKAPSKAEEGKLHVKYSVSFVPLETQYNVLETDYKNYAVLWSCNGIGLVHTRNAWIMTRQRLPPGEILQKAYGVLDKYKISRFFFMKVPQDDCAYLDSPPEDQETKKPVDHPDIAEAEEQDDEPVQSQRPKPLAGKHAVPIEKPHVVSDVVESVHTRKAEVVDKVRISDKVKAAPVTKQAAVKQPVHHAHAAVAPEEKVKPVAALLKEVASQTNESPVVKEAIPEPVVPVPAAELKSSSPIIAEEQVVPDNSSPVKVQGEVEIVKP